MAGARGAIHTRSMNETTPPQEASTSERFFSWLRDLGIVRGNDRWFAGVAGGIAAKAGIDPLIIRGVFVVLAFLGGPGIVLYLAAWFLLPDLNGRIHAEELFRGRASAGVITWSVILGTLIVVPLLVGLLGGWSGGGLWGWSIFGLLPVWVSITLTVLWWALVVPAGIVLLIIWLTRRSGANSAASAANTAASAARTGAAGAAEWGERMSQNATAWAERVGQKADSWGSTGQDAAARAQARAQEASARAHAKVQAATARARAQHEARRLGAGHVVLTLALALIAAAAAAVWALTSQPFDVSGLPAGESGAVLLAVIAALAVVALSLIVAGIRGRNSGWIGFLAFCGVVTLIFTSIIPWGSRVQPFGTVDLTVTSTEHPAALTVLAGNANVDLRQLDGQHDLSVWVLAGNATVTLPDDLPVEVRIIVGAGNIREQPGETEARRLSGPFLSNTIRSNLDGAKPDDISRISVHVLAGNVQVTGGESATQSEGSRAGNSTAGPRGASAATLKTLEKAA